MKSGEVITHAKVFMGQADKVGLTPARDVSALLPVLSDGGLDAEVVFKSPLSAPVAAGAEVGELILRPEGLPEIRVPVMTTEAVAKGGFMVRMRTATRFFMTRLIEGPEGTL